MSGITKDEFGLTHWRCPLSRRILAGEFKEGETAIVDYVDGEYVFDKTEPARKRERAVARS